MQPPTLNGLQAVSVRVTIPRRGPWTADIDLDPAVVPVLPTGPGVLLIGTRSLPCTIDDANSGKFGGKMMVHVYGGGAGWHKPVSAQHFQAPSGVTSTAVLTATAAAVGERVVDVTPTILGATYTRTAGAASRVLAGLEWYVDVPTGTTFVGPRPPETPAKDLEILAWNPLERRASIATDEVLLPGTVLTDQRFGSVVVLDVEQSFSDSGRAEAWCGTASSIGSRLLGAIASVARETIRPEYLCPHTYRVVLQDGSGKLALQSLQAAGSVPDMLPITMCMGVPGFDAKLTPGVQVIVMFADADPSRPFVVGFLAGAPPIQVANSALDIALGDAVAATGVATAASQATVMAALQAFLIAIQPMLNFPTIVGLSGGTSSAAAGAAAVAAPLCTPALPTNYSLRVRAA